MTKPKDTTPIKKTFYQEIATAIAKARDGGMTVPEILEAFKEHVGMTPNENSDGTMISPSGVKGQPFPLSPL
jgi:hypothetical protein